MKLFTKTKSFISDCFNVQPVVTTFVTTFVPLYTLLILPQKYQLYLQRKELDDKRDKINILKKASAEYDTKWGNISDYTRELLDEQRSDLDSYKSLGREVFGEDIDCSGKLIPEDELI
jgi:hypothetical protein